jgi:hypothetical protein
MVQIDLHGPLGTTANGAERIALVAFDFGRICAAAALEV